MKKCLLCDISCILLALAITLFGGYWYLNDKLIKQTEHTRVFEVIKQSPQEGAPTMGAKGLKESSVNKVRKEYSYTAMNMVSFESAVKITE
jgi:hypothetical protein